MGEDIDLVWIYDKYTASRRSINACCCGMYDLVMVNGDVASSLTFRRDGWDARLESLTGAPLPWPDVLPGEPA